MLTCTYINAFLNININSLHFLTFVNAFPNIQGARSALTLLNII